MPVAMQLDMPGGTKEIYEAFNQQMFGGAMNPDQAPEGLIVHTAGAAGDGWRIFDVWESREAFERFMREHVAPAAEAMGVSMDSEPEVYELHNVYP